MNLCARKRKWTVISGMLKEMYKKKYEETKKSKEKFF